MALNAAVAVALALVLAAFAMTLMTAAAHRWWRLGTSRRDAAAAKAIRPRLFDVMGGDEGCRRELLAARRRTGRVLERVVVDLLGKVRGEDRDTLVELLVDRGTLRSARVSTKSRSSVRRARAAELLGVATYLPALPDLVALLEDRDPDVRLAAVRALGKLADPEAAAALLRSLDGPRALPAGATAMALLRLGNTAFEPLQVALRSGEPPARACAAEVLGAARSLASTGQLIAGLSTDPDGEVRIRCARALGRIGSRRATEALIASLVEQNRFEVRAVVAKALGDVGDTSAIPALVAALDDPRHRVAANAGRALAAMGTPGAAALEQAATRDGSGGAHAREAMALLTLANPPARGPSVPSGMFRNG